MYNRVALKNRAKSLIRTGTPAPYRVILVYLLATTWLSTIVEYFVENPVAKAELIMSEWYNQIMGISQEISEFELSAMINALNQDIWRCFQGTAALVGMLVAVLILLYEIVVDFGLNRYCLRVMRGEEAGYKDLFCNFDLATKIILLFILKFVVIALWSCLFVIPGLIAAYKYRQAEYCLYDDPEISILMAMKRSKNLMQGRKMQLVITDLSFIGWILLANIAVQTPAAMFTNETVATFAALVVSTLVNLFILTYRQLTYAGFYQFIKETPITQIPPVNNPGNGFGNRGDHDDRDPWSR